MGSSKNIEDRFRGHRWELRRGSHYASYLQNAWNKYGEESFEFKCIDELPESSPDQLIEVEQWWIDVLQPTYNSSQVAGRPPSFSERPRGQQEVTRQKLREANLGKVHTEETREKIRQQNYERPPYHLSEEARKRIGQGNQGKVRSPELRDRIRQKLLGRKFGRRSDEARSRISEGLRKSWARRKGE